MALNLFACIIFRNSINLKCDFTTQPIYQVIYLHTYMYISPPTQPIYQWFYLHNRGAYQTCGEMIALR